MKKRFSLISVLCFLFLIFLIGGCKHSVDPPEIDTPSVSETVPPIVEPVPPSEPEPTTVEPVPPIGEHMQPTEPEPPTEPVTPSEPEPPADPTEPEPPSESEPPIDEFMPPSEPEQPITITRTVTIEMFDSGGNGWGGNGALRINVNVSPQSSIEN